MGGLISCSFINDKEADCHIDAVYRNPRAVPIVWLLSSPYEKTSLYLVPSAVIFT